MSDGGNLQWVERDFTQSSLVRRAPTRRRAHGVGPARLDALELAPDIWDDVAGTATANDDVLAYGDSYAYVDHFGTRQASLKAFDNVSRASGTLLGTRRRAPGLCVR